MNVKNREICFFVKGVIAVIFHFLRRLFFGVISSNCRSIGRQTMPFYRLLLVTRNDLAVASLYNKFVETAKYVMNNGGVFQRIYNTGDHLFRYVFIQKILVFVDIPCFAKQTQKHIHKDRSLPFSFAVLRK